MKLLKRMREQEVKDGRIIVGDMVQKPSLAERGGLEPEDRRRNQRLSTLSRAQTNEHIAGRLEDVMMNEKGRNVEHFEGWVNGWVGVKG